MTEQHISYCRICEALCGIVVDVEDGHVVKVRGDDAHPVSKGYLCPKGAAMAKVQDDPDRVRYPLKRVGGPGQFVRVTWEEALSDIAERLRRIVRDHGPDAVAMYQGNPSSFSLSHMFWSKGFMDALGSKQFYSAMPQDTGSRCVASELLYGSPLLFPIPDIPHTDFLLILGANPLVSHGSLISLPRIGDELRAIVARGGRVVVVDPARTKTASAFEHMPIRPGADVWLLAAMLHVLFADDRVGRAAIADVAIGLAELEHAVAPFTVERVAAETGIDAEAIRTLARDFAHARTAVAYGRVGICRGPYTTAANCLLDALNVVTGNFDRRGGWVFGDGPIDLVGMGARFGMATYGDHVTRVGGLPDVAGHLPWVLIDEMTTPGAGQVRALIVSAGNPVLSAPDGRALENAMAGLDLIVSLDIYVTETNRHADYVLPGPTFLERADVPVALLGHMPRPWIQATDAVVAPPPEVREEWLVYDELAKRVGLGAPFGQRSARLLGRLGVRLRPRFLTDVLLQTSARGAWFGLRRRGLSLRKLTRHPHGLTLGDAPPVGTAAKHIRHGDGKVHLGDPRLLTELTELDEKVAQGAPDQLLLIGRRDLRSINSWLHNVGSARDREPTLHVHPLDAARLRLLDGGSARVVASNDAVDVLVEVTDAVTPGVVSYPHGWGHEGGWQTANARGGSNFNRLASTRVAAKDRLSGASHLDGIPVQIEPREVASSSAQAPVPQT